MSLFLFNKEASQMAFSILSRWVSRTPETALQELLDGRPFFQTIVFCRFSILTVFGWKMTSQD